MAGPRTLQRLARIQELEEQQARAALEAALAGLRHLQEQRRAAAERERVGRRLIAAAVLHGEKVDWVAGQQEIHIARRVGAMLQRRIAEAEKEVVERRQAFLARRVDRRQTETLIAEAEAGAARESALRVQQATDEWFLDRSSAARTERGNPAGRAAQDSAGSRNS